MVWYFFKKVYCYFPYKIYVNCKGILGKDS
jgi:hypothetical protein